jgi:hypothetical protein
MFTGNHLASLLKQATQTQKRAEENIFGPFCCTKHTVNLWLNVLLTNKLLEVYSTFCAKFLTSSELWRNTTQQSMNKG